MTRPRGWTPEDEEAFRKAFRKGAPRCQRAHRFASDLVGALSDFLPQDKVCCEAAIDYLIRLSFLTNACIINVPPEWDALDKLRIEAAMLEARKGPPAFVPAEVRLDPRPVAFRVGSGETWGLFEDEGMASRAHDMAAGSVLQGLYVRDGK